MNTYLQRCICSQKYYFIILYYFILVDEFRIFGSCNYWFILGSWVNMIPSSFVPKNLADQCYFLGQWYLTFFAQRTPKILKHSPWTPQPSNRPCGTPRALKRGYLWYNTSLLWPRLTPLVKNLCFRASQREVYLPSTQSYKYGQIRLRRQTQANKPILNTMSNRLKNLFQSLMYTGLNI